MLGQILTGIIDSLLLFIKELGYLGIFIGMTIESSFIPLPSELILIPAGALIARGEMNFWLVLILSTIGSLVGASINYFLSMSLGRKAINFLVSKYGKLFFINDKTLEKSDNYFKKHGEITTFVGRLIFGVRHLISIPAGFSRMNFFKFSFYTCLGAALWTVVLLCIGYFFGSTIAPMQKFSIAVVFILFSAIIVITYFLLKKRKNKEK